MASSPEHQSDDGTVATPIVGRRGSVGRGTVELVAGPEVDRIGLAFSTMPPQKLIIRRVTAGTWAEEKGIEPGDVFEAINGRDVSELTKEDFIQLMKDRPLTMRIGALCDDYDEEGTDKNDHDSPPAGRRRTLLDTESEQFRTLQHEFSKLDGQSLDVIAVPVAAKPEVFNVEETGRSSSAETGSISKGPEYVVGIDTTIVGLSFQSLPPSKPVVIDKIHPGTWASTTDIAPGDELVSIEDRNVDDMQREEFMELMKHRPLHLHISSGRRSFLLSMIGMG